MEIKSYIIFVLLFCSCKYPSDEVDVSFFEDLKHTMITGPILTIYCQYDECGEWGGHEERILVNKNDYQELTLKYIKYDVNCDSIVSEFDGKGYVLEALRTLKIEKDLELGRQEVRSIYRFSNEMIKSKFTEQFPDGHAGVILSISNYDSTFHISTYGGNVGHFRELLKDLNL